MITEKDLLTVKINKIFKSSDFNKYYCSKYKFSPSGMTFELNEKDNGKFEPVLVVKKYGIESSTTGLNEFEDLNDYIIENFDFSNDQYLYVLKYFMEEYPEIYSRFK